jgi:hypothetical protein
MLDDIIKNEQSWGKEEWQEMKAKLAVLSSEKLKLLAKNVGIRFSGEDYDLSDHPKLSTEEQLILVMDEVPKDKLILEYEKLKEIIT